MKIGYYSEPVPDYHKGLDGCADLTALRAFLADWRLVAHDAELIAQAMTPADWRRYQKGLRRERRGRFAGEQWSQEFAAIPMPSILFNVSIIASKFFCPWGCAYIRSKEEGLLIEEDGIASWKGPS